MSMLLMIFTTLLPTFAVYVGAGKFSDGVKRRAAIGNRDLRHLALPGILTSFTAPYTPELSMSDVYH